MVTLPAKPPVYVITHEFYPKRGGIATFTEEIAKATAELGYDVEVWAQTAAGGVEKPWPFRVRRLPLKGTHDLSEPGPMLAMMFLQFFHAFRPKSLTLTFHGSEILKFHAFPSTRLLTRKLIRRATRISTLTNFTQNLLCEHFPEAVGKTFLTPGALRSDFDLAERAAAASENKGRTIILTVGRLHPRKGQLLVLQSLKSLPTRIRNNIEYWVVGTASKESYAQHLREAAAACDFPIRFYGDLPDDELDRIYDRADIFAMTSVNQPNSIEGFGLVYLEAAAHGLPIIAHPVGGVAEAVVDGVTGLLIPPHHPTQLTAAFERLILDPGLRRKLGEAGRGWALKNSWRHSAEMLFNTSDLASVS